MSCLRRIAPLIVATVTLCTAASLPARAGELDDLFSRFSQTVSSGDFTTAADIGEQLLVIAERDLPPKDPNIALILASLAGINAELGELEKAEAFYLKAAKLHESMKPPDRQALSDDLNGLGQVYRRLGRAVDAQAALTKALAVQEEISGPNSVDLIGSLYNLAMAYDSNGQFDQAEDLLLRAIYIATSNPSAESTAIALFNALGQSYDAANRNEDAVRIYRMALSRAKTLYGPSHADVATISNNLALVLDAMSQDAEAETFYRSALSMREVLFAPDDTMLGQSFANLGGFYVKLGRDKDAKPLLERAMFIAESASGSEVLLEQALNSLATIAENANDDDGAEQIRRRVVTTLETAFGPNDPGLAWPITNLANLLRYRGKIDEALQLHHRALTLREAVDDPLIVQSLEDIATDHQRLGQYHDAGPFLLKALEIRQKTTPDDHAGIALAFNQVAFNLSEERRSQEAELYARQALAASEKIEGSDHTEMANALNNLASALADQGRYSEAESLWKRCLQIREKEQGPESLPAAEIIDNLSVLLDTQFRYDEAAPLHERAIAIYEKALGKNHPDYLIALSNYALASANTGEGERAERLYLEVLASKEKSLGKRHPSYLDTQFNLATLYRDTGRFDEAEPLYQHIIASWNAFYGKDDNERSTYARSALSSMYFLQQRWQDATRLMDVTIAAFIREFSRTRSLALMNGVDQTQTWSRKNQARLSAYLMAKYRVASLDKAEAAKLFEVAQWLNVSSAAQSLADMAVRSGLADTTLRPLVRARQDLLAEWRRADAAFLAGGDATSRARLDQIDAQIAKIDAEIKARFPEFSALAAPEPLSIENIRAALNNDEVLLFYFDTAGVEQLDGETFLWAVTRNEMHWEKLALRPEEAQDKVRLLRKALGVGGTVRGMEGPAEEVTNKELVLAHELYRDLLDPVTGMIVGKKLIVVPSPSLSSLPFQLLASALPEESAQEDVYAATQWIIRDHAVTMLPSVTALEMLRQRSQASHAPKPFIGIGDPLLNGHRTSAADTCAAITRGKMAPVQVALAADSRGVSQFFRGALGDVAALRSLAELPETADELCDVAASLGADDDAVLLAKRATETMIKSLNASGELASARILHFATHGLVAGELSGLAEPGLVLTPPDKASEADDGLLTATEVATLRLDADWVILSACNTAAGESGDAEALSGLARAFFYAGTRALLVSHWPVNSKAAVELTTETVAAMRRDPKLDRAEALRQAMLRLIDRGGPSADPAYWAPFVLIGVD